MEQMIAIQDVVAQHKNTMKYVYSLVDIAVW